MRFSVVVAAYNVARYLTDFCASIDAQTLPAEEFEVVVVDDGSTDSTLADVRAWAATTRVRVRVLTKANGGQSTARNLGVDTILAAEDGLVGGQWITFLDPDDVIHDDYLAKVAAFLDRHADVDMIATNRVMLDDASGKVTDTHPLRWMFRGGDSVRDLVRDRSYFHGSAPSAFFRSDVLDRTGLRFSDEVRPNFEDGHFSSHYLLAFEAPRVGFLQSAHYVYRKRRDSSSTLQQSLGDSRRYIDVLRHGYLEVLESAHERYGAAPEWLQNFIIYELHYYFTAYANSHGAATPPPDRLEEFHELMRRILEHVEIDVIRRCEQPTLAVEWRLAMMHAYRDEPWTEEAATIVDYDREQRLVKLSYRFTGPTPAEEFELRGELIEPPHAKTRVFEAHGRVMLSERTIWLPARQAVHVRLHGQSWPVQVQRPTVARTAVRRRNAARLEPGSHEVHPHPYVAPTDEQLRLLAAATRRLPRRAFADAWVLMDRVHDADDSGEHLFRWLRENRPEINAWFVLEKGTPDWRRLRKEGYGRRLVDYGSHRWKLLMLNAKHLISSHADEPIVHPPGLEFTAPRWRFTFLQHGVIKDDLSKWLNTKPIETFVTSTAGEYDSIVADGNAYRFSSREVVLTGLPRFDLVREAGAAVPPPERDLLLVAPTWRQWLVKPLTVGSQRRATAGEVLETDFVQQWLAFLRDPALTAVAQRQNLRIALLPHPNLASLAEQLDLPEGIEMFGFDGDVRKLFARAAVLVTDYSSMAFNAAYIDRPVVYFQFDADRVLGGAHVGRAGYFDYGRDGFGPVATDVAAAVEATVETIEHGRAPAAPYAERIAATFGQRDGRCRERVFEAIVASTQPGGRG
ncbi:CDP-glycerol glycerophosphotransferase family protein [Nocardioides sp. zg-ZUI104]|uniref:bifunctional glycosyltransferase/CDP-glycerol:glycerophosphate glycerophosphotransferase n=1 Tax=Nocardioides faecalis TaxID=2803858 RepID=UPI001BD06C07|nr:CDP-glycerol glycerophosphotransferase family protein [Nocardioides faecalis]MBS4752054.1 CDP-glycerol glycerophosphotransferase family protein [Nocardioides faecalis]